MSSTLRAANVPIADIRLDDLFFSVSDPEPDDALRESVRRHGVIHAPVLLANGGSPDRHIVVCGHRRLRAAVDAGIVVPVG